MLTIHIVAIGEKMPGWVQQGYGQYAKRIRGRCKINLIEVAAARRGKNADFGNITRLEAERISQAIPPDTRVIALTRNGKTQSTLEISRRLETWMQHGEQVSLLLGGADGLPLPLLRAADETWSLSQLTFAHPLARVIVAEQMYRCYSLLEGLPYHRSLHGTK